MRALAAAALLLAVQPSVAARRESFADAGRAATRALVRTFYAGNGRWRECSLPDCSAGNRDRGDDSLTYTIALRYQAPRDARLRTILRRLAASAPGMRSRPQTSTSRHAIPWR